MPNTPGIYTYTYYIGACDTTFPFHIKDYSLASISYLCGGCSKDWFVLPPVNNKKIEQVLAAQMICPNYVNDHDGGVDQVLAMETATCDPHFLNHTDSTLMIIRVSQSYCHFVTCASGAHHRGCNTGYNIAQATSFADNPW